MTNGDFAFFTFAPVRDPETDRPWTFYVTDPKDLPRRRRAFHVVKQVLAQFAVNTRLSVLSKIIGTCKNKGLDTCYSTIYMSQTRDQQRFTVAGDWHKPMVPQRIMWPSIARANEQLDPRCS